MRMYNTIQPEVIVGLGEKTEFLEKEPPFKTVIKLHIELEDWLGDDLMECHPCYIVTEKLKLQLKESNFSGFIFEEISVTKNEYFDNNYQLNKPLAKFYWLKVNGDIDVNSMYINNTNTRLLLSEELLNWIKSNFSAKHLSEDNSDVDDFEEIFSFTR